MGKVRTERRAVPLRINAEAQIGATHNANFPLSSPMLSEKRSAVSSRSGLSAPRYNMFSSPDPSISAFTDSSCEGSNERDESRSHTRKESKQGSMSSASTGLSMSQTRKNTIGLHLVTDFPKPMSKKGVVFNQVPVKQVGPNKTRAVSVISQKGVQIYPSFTGGAPNKDVTVRPPAGSSKQGTKEVARLPITSQPLNHEWSARPTSGRSIVIGLLVPENELEAHRDLMYSAANLVTPSTPAIILTPPEANHSPSRQHITGLMIPKESRRPISSMYSTVFCPDSPREELIPPVPPLPPVTQSQPLRGHNPFRNHPMAQKDPSLDDLDEPQRYSDDSKEYILSEGRMTPRHKSQGWWNLLMSPMLSRASSLASRKGQDLDNEAPPVPRIPSDMEKRTPPPKAGFDLSPETPRRQGLARAGSTWSRWTEWEEERNKVGQRQAETSIVHHESDSWFDIEQNGAYNPGPGKGAASEYYHACAIEQLAGTNYFDCINRSCAEHLPQLKSIHDAKAELEATPGLISITDSREKNDTLRRDTGKEVNNDLVTPIDDDDELDELPFSDKKTPTVTKTPLTPILESDSEPDELSPNVRKANTAAVVRAKALGSPESSSTPLPAYSSPRGNREIPNIAAIIPPSSGLQVIPPNTKLFESTRSTAPLGTPQMLQYHQPVSQPQPAFITSQTIFPELPTRHAVAPVTIFDLCPDHRHREKIEERRIQNEKEDARVRKVGGLWRGRGCMPKNGCFGRNGPEGRKRRRWLMCIAATLLAVVVVCIVLATTLHRGGDTAIQSQWLNLTGYPPMPTGISTIAQPNLVRSENRCVTPTTMWSCTLPKEDQASVAPNDPNQPNLRFQISFENGTVPTNMTIPLTKRSVSSSAGGFFLPNPSPPSQPDQIFLGNTTDNITAPFDGERTPFFITFMSASPVLPTPYNGTQTVLTRDLQYSIPAPAIASDGTAAPASLLPTAPYPVSQPVKLYNRGLQDEHFGFYMYYDKSIFLANVAISNTAAAASLQPNNNADQNGGSLKSLANVRCTFSQTRFLVKIFTDQAFGATLLSNPTQNLSATNAKSTTNSSATNFNRPGSFPYPTTIILDRHGGSLNSKLTYCYGMSGGVINATQRQLVFEDRSVGGVLVNPAPSVVADGSTFDANAGGVDGGTGGCGCTWQNWS